MTTFNESTAQTKKLITFQVVEDTSFFIRDNAKYFCLSFFINSEEIMKSKIFHNYEEFYEFINKGCVIGCRTSLGESYEDIIKSCNSQKENE